MQSSRVLVLNQDYQALSVCTPERAFVLVLLKKAELVCDLPGRVLRSVSAEFKFPSIIRLYRYVQIPYKKVSLTRQNVYKRDGYRCVYCGNRDGLTLDHVMPKSRGGRDTWTNLVTACMRCNAKKGNQTPEEAGMFLKRAPFRPSFLMYLTEYSGTLCEDWKPYLMLK